MCDKLDQYNMQQQSTLGMEHKLIAHDWATRFNLTILGWLP